MGRGVKMRAVYCIGLLAAVWAVTLVMTRLLSKPQHADEHGSKQHGGEQTVHSTETRLSQDSRVEHKQDGVVRTKHSIQPPRNRGSLAKHAQPDGDSAKHHIQQPRKEDPHAQHIHRKPIRDVLAEYSRVAVNLLRPLIKRNVTLRDPELVSLVRELMDPPSDHILKNVHHLVKTPQNKEVLSLLNNTKGGFFIEVGALDGERSSNTLYLEARMGWTGLLIEMDPYYYAQLQAKSRKAWSINACISPHHYPHHHGFSGGQWWCRKVDEATAATECVAHGSVFPTGDHDAGTEHNSHRLLESRRRGL